MKYEIESNTEGIAIEVSEIEEKGERLLKAFQECQEGRCSCPTDEYSKLDSLKIEQSEGKISLQLEAKDGYLKSSGLIRRMISKHPLELFRRVSMSISGIIKYLTELRRSEITFRNSRGAGLNKSS